MLKKMLGLVLGLVVLAGSACVTPTHASSASRVIMTYIQAGGAAGAKEELIVLYNSSSEAVDLTDWCLVNKSEIAFACLAGDSGDSSTTYMLQPYGYLSIASEAYVQTHGYGRDYYSHVYTVTNQSSGSIVGGADSISVVTGTGDIIANKSWASGASTNKAWVRLKVATGPDTYSAIDEVLDWQAGSIVDPPTSSLTVATSPVTPGESPENPDTPEVPGSETPSTPLLLLSEIFPNPAGSDTGGEYIEIYNPSHTETVSLTDFLLRIGIGVRTKDYSFPQQSSIAPQAYAVYSNGDISFGLVNTAGAAQLLYRGVAVGDLVEYATAKDDEAWALIGGIWQYTTIPTPGLANLPTPPAILAPAAIKVATAPKACASNQFRNPETGRCKRIDDSGAPIAACKVGQERNPETKRCRSIATATSTPAPCKEGQERNPETNRCRGIVKMSNADYKVQSVQSDADNQPSWYYWAAMAGVVVMVLGYAVWEWRKELHIGWTRLRNLVRK